MSELDIKAIIDLARTSVGVQSFNLVEPSSANSADLFGKRALVVTPQANGLLHVSDYTDRLLESMEHPLYRSGTTRLADLTSFIAFVNRNAMPSTVLFADAKGPVITAVIDYDDPREKPAPLQPVDDTPATIGSPMPMARAEPLVSLNRWGRERAVFAFPKAKPWVVWSERAGRQLGQLDLADFIEEHLADVLDPALLDSKQDAVLLDMVSQLGLKLATPHMLLSTARSLQIKASEQITQVVNTSTGEAQIAYGSTHETGERVTVPNAFVLAVPVFEGGAYFKLLVRLRYKKVEQKVLWTYGIYSADRAYDKAFREACETVGMQTGQQMFYGEAP